MALTALVKDELARYETSKASVRKAEISTILRFTGGLHIVSGRIVVEAEVDSEQTALRMQQTIAEIYGHEAEITSVSGGGLRRGGRYIVRVDAGGEALARQTGLLDLRGRPVRGLPPAVVNGSIQDAEAVMRGAFFGTWIAHRAWSLISNRIYMPRAGSSACSCGSGPAFGNYC